MPSILPVSDLRNYNEVLKNCQVGEPVFLTKNGRGRFVVMDIEDYEREKAEKKLLAMLHQAENFVKDEGSWLDLDKLKSIVGEQDMMKLRINPAVAIDLKNIKEYITQDSQAVAEEVINKLYIQIENIQQFPNIGLDLSKRVRFRTNYKYVIWENYIIFYKIQGEYVEIYRVVNRYQDITKIFE